MSTHSTPVFEPVLLPHPNADSLSIVKIPGTTYQCVTGTEGWSPGQLGAWVEPDSLVDTRREEFAFLANQAGYNADSTKGGGPYARIRAIRLRGELSYGLLVPLDTDYAPDPALEPVARISGKRLVVRADATEALGILHYEPPLPASNDAADPPPGYFPIYDVEALEKFPEAFDPVEAVVVTEKIHGANARYVCIDGQIHVGSRTRWVGPGSVWHQALENHPEVAAWLLRHEGFCLYGEVYGPVQSLRYGLSRPRIAIFDILEPDGQWSQDFAGGLAEGWFADLPLVPLLPHYKQPMMFGAMEIEGWRQEAMGQSSIPGADHIREGIVIAAYDTNARLDDGTRKKFKVINPDYLTGKSKKGKL